MAPDPDDGYRPTLRCPLCGGPVHEETPDSFRCRIGHEASGDEVVATANRRLAEAMWMAIEALDSEAMLLRLLGGDDHESLARDAETQAELLREFGRRHSERAWSGSGQEGRGDT